VASSMIFRREDEDGMVTVYTLRCCPEGNSCRMEEGSCGDEGEEESEAGERYRCLNSC
jgi:hypothetical protein